MIQNLPAPYDLLWFRVILGFVVGSLLGSFATMLVYRLPRRLSIVAPGSACPSCHTSLKVRDLVPIVSFLSTRGHCRYCRVKIPPRYLWIEIAVSAACAVATAAVGLHLLWLPLIFMLIITLAVAITLKVYPPAN